MKNKIKYIIIFLLVIIAIVVTAIVLLNLNQEEEIPRKPQANTTTEENVLVVEVGKNTTTEPEPEPDPEPTPEPTEPEPTPEPQPQTELDPAEITFSINNLKMNIGTLYIPKTNLTTPVYCENLPNKMEKMPCFLYTTGGINKPGVTLITGHNRRNGKLFSNNKKLKVGDVFYFNDYEGLELKYSITDVYITNSNDTSFFNIETDIPIIVLSCCTDASNDDRIIIIGRAGV